ncbi:DUF4199 domain-containing protein [Spirosoma sp. BT702]|uniref:DUF4199 domain-containing protein n=1 Tax=Spirosoma profusum TaxID=2771354 RepID=A0A926XUX4_9BACT|nr:DUF4199 domain-containing protein [Spirosoma profusum]MBD2700943.1 DUF4199 domain-containing protein [Spirosoma profusum]
MNEQITPTRIALKWGLILGIAMILYSIVTFVTDSVGNAWLGSVSYVLIIIGIILAMRDFRTLNGGYMTYGQGLTIGMLMGAVAGLLSSLFSVFYLTVIDTGIMERAAETARERMEDEGKMSDEQIDQAIGIMEKFQSPGFLFVFGVIGTALLALIFSLVIAAFIRRNKDNPFE